MTDFTFALEEIASNMIELTSGSNKILQAANEISEITQNVRNSVNSVSYGIKEIQKASINSQNISKKGVNHSPQENRQKDMF